MKSSIVQTGRESSKPSTGRQADWLWRSASKNRLQASFLILSQSLFFTKVLMHEWPEKKKDRAKHQKCFWSVCVCACAGGVGRPQLNASTWILIDIQPSSKEDEQPFWDCACTRIRIRSEIKTVLKYKRRHHLSTDNMWSHTFLYSCQKGGKVYRRGQDEQLCVHMCFSGLACWNTDLKNKIKVKEWEANFIIVWKHVSAGILCSRNSGCETTCMENYYDP